MSKKSQIGRSKQDHIAAKTAAKELRKHVRPVGVARVAGKWKLAISPRTAAALSTQICRTDLALRKLQARCEKVESRLEEAEGLAAARGQTLSNLGHPPPKDPPAEDAAKGPYLHRAPGSFESGRRR